MQDDLLIEYEVYQTAHEMWEALKEKYGGLLATKLRELVMKFGNYKMRLNHTMKQHLREMKRMIRELKIFGHVLTNEQQVETVIKSLPKSWDHMVVNMTHNESVKTFDDIVRHLELEVGRLVVARPNEQAYVVESSSRKTSGFKRHRNFFRKNKKSDDASKKGKIGARKKFKCVKKDKSKLKCYDCGNKGHFARECIESKRIRSCSNNSCAYVSSYVMLTESIPLWTIDSAATDHIARDQGAYIEFRRISFGTRWIYVGNNSKVEVKGIGTCKLKLSKGRTLFLHDVLYALDIRRNLVSMLVLLSLGFNLIFHDSIMELYLGTTYYGYGFILNGFMVLDIDNCVLSNTNDNYYSLMTTSRNTCDNVII